MKSIRLKLILGVLLITLGGIASVVVSNLKIVSSSQQESVRASNRQVTEIVSKALFNQIADYQHRFEYVFRSWLTNPNLELDSELYPDYVWIHFMDRLGQPLFEWSQGDRLEQAKLTRDLLLGYKNREELFQEVKVQIREQNSWLVFNSTIQTLYPTFLLATAFKKPGEEDFSVFALAEIHAEKLLSHLQSRQGQEIVFIDSHQNILISSKPGWDPSDLVFTDQVAMDAISEIKVGENSFRLLDYPLRGTLVTSIYKFKQGGGLTLMLQEPLEQVLAGSKSLTWQAMIVAFVVLNLAIIFLIFMTNSITSPLVELSGMMEKVGKGEFTGKIKVQSKDEIGRLAGMFNKMLTDLKAREDEVEGAKAKLIQSEKMSAFGQMSAGIAHEVKNPLAGILGYAQMSKKKLPQNSEIQPYLDIIEKEALRCKEIVENLMRFARQEKASMARIDINKTIKDSIRLVEHQMSISGIKLIQAYAMEGAPVWIKGNANQIQQVMMNLMLNAQQAMDNKGTLTVSTHYDQESQKILIMISDTGMGMSEEVKARIFEPFFTTKGVGKGTGLGLSVTIGIIKDHGGLIDVESAPGKGTTFTITLPCDRNTDESEKKQVA